VDEAPAKKKGIWPFNMFGGSKKPPKAPKPEKPKKK
jgi:hypothetical protein